MKTILKYILVLSGIAGLGSGCIKEEFPSQTVTPDQIAGSPQGLAAAVNALNASLTAYGTVYDAHWDFGWPAICVGTDALTCDVAVKDYGYDPGALYWRACLDLTPEGNMSRWVWGYMYRLNLLANAVIGPIDPDNMNETQKQYLGQALVYRAMAYFHMARIYEYKGKETGSFEGLTVPIVDQNTTESMAKNNPRVSADKMYNEFIIPDLENAVKYLEGYKRTKKNQVDQSVALGMLARVYLQRENWDGARKAARKAIDLSGAKPLTETEWTDPKSGFNDMNTSSWMWGISITADDRVVTTGICNFVSFMAPEASYGYSYAGGGASAKQIDINLYKKIPDTDWRKQSWLDPDRKKYAYKTCQNQEYLGTLLNYTSIKFRPAEGNGSLSSVGSAADFPLMRVEEMILIEAEAEGMLNLGTGKTLLENFVKTNRNTAFTSRAADAKAFQSEIFLQRQIEFWGEGIVMFDYKRLDKPQMRGYAGTNHFAECRYNSPDGNAPWTSLPLPLDELNSNTTLKSQQNPIPVDYRGELWVE